MTADLAYWTGDLGSDLHAARRGRNAVRQRLLCWQLPELMERVAMTVSELVGNAVVHGIPPVQLTLRRLTLQLQVEVHDDDPTSPPLDRRTVQDDSEDGRGLIIAAMLADNLTYERVPGDGKLMLASFAIPPHLDDGHTQ